MRSIATFCLIVLVQPILAQQQPPDNNQLPSKETILKALKEATAKQASLFREQSAITREISQNEDLLALRKAANEAAKAYSDAIRTKQATSRKELQEAQEAYDKLSKKQLAENPELKKVEKDKDALEEKLKDARYKRALANFQLTNSLSPIQRALDKDPELINLQKQSRGFQGRQQSQAARQKKLESMEEARPLIKAMEEAKIEEAKLQKELAQLSQKQFRIRAKVQRGADSPELRAARAKMDEARKAMTNVYRSEEVLKLAKEQNEARLKADQKYRSLFTDNPRLKELQKEMAKVNNTLRELRELQRKVK